jgi:4-hydroxy-tetrahydrodipicolinate synthase
MNINRFKGLGVAMVTPFKANKEIDFEALKKLTQFLIDNNVDYLVVQGTTGESPVLSAKEKEQVLDTVVEINQGKLPIVYGIGGNNTQAIAEQLKNFDRKDVDAILSVSPYYNKPTQNGIFQHYKTISETANHPIIIYNVPGRTSSNILAETTLKIAKNCKNILAVKEASGNFEQIMELIQNKPNNFLVISGDDAITMPFIAAGGDGVISVVGNAFPKQFSHMVHAGLKQNVEKSREIHYHILPIIKHLFSEGNPAGVKEVLKELGLMKNEVRLPLVNISEKTKNIIKDITKSIKQTY